MTDTSQELLQAALDGKNGSLVESCPLPQKKSFQLVVGSDGFDSQASYLIKNHIPASAMGVLYGASGSFKSFLAISLACCIATGREWNGCPVIKGSVVYVVAEGGAGAPRRIKGWENLYNDGKRIANLLTIRHPVFTGDAVQVDKMIQTVKDAEKQTGDKVGLIVLDTLARCFAGADENKTADMNRFIAGCDQIKAATGATILIIHHSGKGDDASARGSSALRAAADFEFRVNRPEDNDMSCILTNTKAKDSEERAARIFRMQHHFLFTDDDGDDVLTLVPELNGEIFEKTENRPTLSKNKQAIWQGIRSRMQNGHSTARSVILDDMKAQGFKTSNFARELDGMISDGFITQSDDGELQVVPISAD